MPFAGYICKVKGTVVSAQQCERCARQGAPQACPMTAPVVAGMTLGIRKRDGFTATELLGCLRKVRLKREHDYCLDPEELYWAFRGQLLHDVAKRWVRRGDEDAIAETRFTARVFVDAEPISGQPDLVYRDRRHVVDYKTCRRLPGTWKTYRCQSCGQVMQEGEKVIRKNLKKYECPHCEHAHDYAARLTGLTEEPPRAPKPRGPDQRLCLDSGSTQHRHPQRGDRLSRYGWDDPRTGRDLADDAGGRAGRRGVQCPAGRNTA